jgi:hypothetical protein
MTLNWCSVKGCRSLSLAGLLVAIAVSGCGDSGPANKDLGDPMEVSGTVTMDGTALPDVEVIFTTGADGVAAEHRRFSAKTDSSGAYKIEEIYANNYGVSIVAAGGGEDDPDAEPDDEAPAEDVPSPLSKYGSNSTLTANVAEGKTTFDFPLDSEPDTREVPGAEEE